MKRLWLVCALLAAVAACQCGPLVPCSADSECPASRCDTSTGYCAVVSTGSDGGADAGP